MKKNKNAFTLVELIVVVITLAILATIGFISLQGYSSSARDSKRISELSEIRTGLNIYQARNSVVPIPSEERVTIGSGATNLIIQGYAGQSVLREIRMAGVTMDPVDNEYYTYSTNANLTKFQLLALLENSENSIAYNLNIIPTTYASYENRYLYTLGQDVGVILDENNTPIQKSGNNIIDLGNDPLNYKVLFLDEAKTLSGNTLYEEIVIKTNNLGNQQVISSGSCLFDESNFNECNFF